MFKVYPAESYKSEDGKFTTTPQLDDSLYIFISVNLFFIIFIGSLVLVVKDV